MLVLLILHLLESEQDQEHEHEHEQEIVQVVFTQVLCTAFNFLYFLSKTPFNVNIEFWQTAIHGEPVWSRQAERSFCMPGKQKCRPEAPVLLSKPHSELTARQIAKKNSILIALFPSKW